MFSSLKPSSRSAPYISLPTLSPSAPSSSEKMAPHAGSSRRRLPWHLILPAGGIVLLVLFLSSGSNRRKIASSWSSAGALGQWPASDKAGGYTMGELANPYICMPEPPFKSVQELCEASARPGKGDETVGAGASNWGWSAPTLERWDLGVDRHLTEEQCEMVFPEETWYEADRAADYYRKKGGVTLEDLDKAMEKGAHARGLIYRNRFYVKEFAGGPGLRTQAALAAINEAVLTSLHPIPDIEFVLQTFDTGDASAGSPIWVLGRKDPEEHLWLMPDYGWYSWPEPGVGSFLEVQDQTLVYETGLTWADKFTAMFWRGALLVPMREEFVKLANKYFWGKEISDIDWRNPNDVLKTPAEHCGYKYLAHIEGYAASGRLKYILQCRSVTVAYPMEYIQHFHYLFNTDNNSPDQNMVLFERMEDLPNVVQGLIDDDERAERIANTSFAFFRKNLSPASVDCYWRRLFKRWAEVQRFTPKLGPKDPSYASFQLVGRTQWDPHR